VANEVTEEATELSASAPGGRGPPHDCGWAPVEATTGRCTDGRVNGPVAGALAGSGIRVGPAAGTGNAGGNTAPATGPAAGAPDAGMETPTTTALERIMRRLRAATRPTVSQVRRWEIAGLRGAHELFDIGLRVRAISP
jgi:hypothetical protein